MSTKSGSENSARIAIDDIITSVGQGAQRALSARQQAAAASAGFYIDLHIRCGIPPVVLQALNAEQGVAGVSESRTQ